MFVEAKQKRSHLLEYDARAATINKLGTRRELRAQQAATLERKHYFEHLQQTFEATGNSLNMFDLLRNKPETRTLFTVDTAY
ncbi:unnamed protein product [Rotaria sp. Silwood2]|nr:unnamed protein product [Rotaria sp. Silwood2]